MRPDLSVVVPVYSEAESLPELADQIRQALDGAPSAASRGSPPDPPTPAMSSSSSSSDASDHRSARADDGGPAAAGTAGEGDGAGTAVPPWTVTPTPACMRSTVRRACAAPPPDLHPPCTPDACLARRWRARGADGGGGIGHSPSKSCSGLPLPGTTGMSMPQGTRDEPAASEGLHGP